MPKPKYSKDDFIKAYNSSSTREELLSLLNLSPKSGTLIPQRCKEYNLDLSKLSKRKSFKISDSQLLDYVKLSTSRRQVLEKMGLAPKGGNYKTLDNRIRDLNIDITHFKGKGWNKGIAVGPKRPIEDYLNNLFPIQSTRLRIRLINEEIFSHVCGKCNNTEWNGLPIPLELDHINGIHTDNELTNLILLCPNCHAQTPTYRGKNMYK